MFKSVILVLPILVYTGYYRKLIDDIKYFKLSKNNDM